MTPKMIMTDKEWYSLKKGDAFYIVLDAEYTPRILRTKVEARSKNKINYLGDNACLRQITYFHRTRAFSKLSDAKALVTSILKEKIERLKDNISYEKKEIRRLRGQIGKTKPIVPEEPFKITF